ncbi:hypothetical protein NEFER03_0296 [Nematocida sp. LUAm3]|nr:hypothetical protein NEFER03_0296 [Nematocida sp. LUAm3]KAI5173748.1 hypothetical protein NEFER02_0264 [Nematocida sp. LUAm2]KAI5176971.1 hypothetical protein NEFER01_0296 [Nematocida sp. LUAm1]
MYFKNRELIDKVGLVISFSLLFYLGGAAPFLLLRKSIEDNVLLKSLVVSSNVLSAIILMLFFKVSSTRGYVKEERYILGGKFCYVCKQAKPERVHHCSKCNKCINRMDHHCPWIGACVNGKNFGNFTKLLFLVMIGTVLQLCMYGIEAHKRLKVCQGMCTPSFFSFILTTNIICLIGLFILLLSLFVRQVQMSIKNITYLEHLQIARLKEMNLICPENPYDKGAAENIKETHGNFFEFFLCKTPKASYHYGYKVYWPPMRVGRPYMQASRDTLEEPTISK